jgi:hypothetical protein
MTPQEQYEIYKQQRTEREARQKQFNDDRIQHREATQAFYAAKYGKTHTSKTTVHTCHLCQKTIQIGEQYTAQPITMAGGDQAFGHIETEFSCSECTKKRQNQNAC